MRGRRLGFGMLALNHYPASFPTVIDPERIYQSEFRNILVTYLARRR